VMNSIIRDERMWKSSFVRGWKEISESSSDDDVPRKLVALVSQKQRIPSIM